MIDINDYNDSQINLDEILNFARQIAKNLPEQKIKVLENKQRIVSYGILNLKKRTETYQEEKLVNKNFWDLKQKRFMFEESICECDITEYEITYCCLRSNGDLIRRIESWRELIHKDRGYFWEKDSYEVREYPITEDSILDFDYSSEVVRGVKGNGKYMIEGIRGELLFKKKGEGIRSALSKIV